MIITDEELFLWKSDIFKKENWFGRPKHFLDKDCKTINVGILSPFGYQFSSIALGHLSIYHHINQNKNCRAIADRIFVYDPLLDPETYKVKSNIRLESSLSSFERSIDLHKLDLICISLTTPENILTCLELLRMGDVPLLAKDRKHKKYPIILAGGPGMNNPEVFANFIDIACIGDGCIATERVCKAINILLEENKMITVEGIFNLIQGTPGIYFPELYTIEYNDHFIKSINPTKNAPMIVKRAIDKAQEYTKSSLLSDGETGVIIPNAGCKFKCSYCIISEIDYYENDFEFYINKVQLMISEGISTIIINSATLTQYSHINELLTGISKLVKESNRKIKVYVGSVRFDELTVEVIENLLKLDALSHTYLLYTKGSQARFMALAPEHGSKTLLKRINRNLDPWRVLEVIKTTSKYEIFNFVLYFLVGIESETYNDRMQIALLCLAILNITKENNGRLIIKINPLIPTPGTACQRFEMISYELYKKYAQEIADKIKEETGEEFFNDFVEIVLLSEERILFESIIYRGDRRLSPLILKVLNDYKNNLKISATNLISNMEILGIKNNYLNAGKSNNEILPWTVTDQVSKLQEVKVLHEVREFDLRVN